MGQAAVPTEGHRAGERCLWSGIRQALVAGTSSCSLQASKCMPMPTTDGALMANGVGTWPLLVRGRFCCLLRYQPRKEDPSLPLDKQIRSLLCQMYLAHVFGVYLDYTLKHKCPPWTDSGPQCVPQLDPCSAHSADLAHRYPKPFPLSHIAEAEPLVLQV